MSAFKDEQERTLWLEFYNKTSYTKFVTALAKDNVLKEYLREKGDMQVAFLFDDKGDRDWALESFKKALKPSQVKTTKHGFNYLRIYR